MKKHYRAQLLISEYNHHAYAKAKNKMWYINELEYDSTNSVDIEISLKSISFLIFFINII
jgi:hypothetical protein